MNPQPCSPAELDQLELGAAYCVVGSGEWWLLALWPFLSASALVYYFPNDESLTHTLDD